MNLTFEIAIFKRDGDEPILTEKPIRTAFFEQDLEYLLCDDVVSDDKLDTFFDFVGQVIGAGIENLCIVVRHDGNKVSQAFDDELWHTKPIDSVNRIKRDLQKYAEKLPK